MRIKGQRKSNIKVDNGGEIKKGKMKGKGWKKRNNNLEINKKKNS